MGPDDLALEVHCEESHAAEVAIDEFAIGDGRFRSVGVFQMNGGLGLSFVSKSNALFHLLGLLVPVAGVIRPMFSKLRIAFPAEGFGHLGLMSVG